MNESELEKTLNELKFDMEKYNLVYAMSEGFSVEESLKKIGRSKGWFYDRLPKDEQNRLKAIACELNANTTAKVRLILDDAKVKAAKVKVAGLDSRDERIKQSASSEIIDRTIGKVPTPINGTVDVNVRDYRADIQRKLAGITDTASEG